MVKVTLKTISFDTALPVPGVEAPNRDDVAGYSEVGLWIFKLCRGLLFVCFDDAR